MHTKCGQYMCDELRIHYITTQQLLPQKFITHKDLELLLHSFPSSPAVVCGDLQWSVVVCGFQTYPVWVAGKTVPPIVIPERFVVSLSSYSVKALYKCRVHFGVMK